MSFQDKILTISDADYRNLDGYSYSLLKSIDDNGPQALVEARSITGPALEFGSLVDILITSPERKDDVFWTKTITKPTASLLELADSILMSLLVEDRGIEDLTDGVINSHITNLGIWSNIKDEVKLKAKYDTPIFYDYIAQSILAKGKIILSQETLEAAEHCASVLLTHEYTRHIFESRDGVEILKQASILYKFKGTVGKARIDLLIIDHNTKKIYVYDIKTGGVLPTKFEESFYHFKYYLQVVSYMLAVQSVIVGNPEFADYTIETFKFIYISKKLPDVPVIIEVPEAMLNDFSHGWRASNGDKVTGFMDLIEDYKWHKENEVYNVERRVIEKEGKLKINLL
jgi:hypothetical protein